MITATMCIAVSGCLKDNSSNVPAIDCSTITTAAPSTEIGILRQKLDSIHVFSRSEDPRGFFYTMDSTAVPDSGAHATPCSNVAVTYSVSQIGGEIFERKDTAIAFSLSNSILGWKEAVPLMKKNATMTLYLPPSLAYGETGYQSVPANAYLTFVIKLYDYSN